LCLASSGLTAFAHEDRQWALVRALQDISAAVEGASRQGIAIWSPLGTADQRIVRLAARDSKLLASRWLSCLTALLQAGRVVRQHAPGIPQIISET
jgi:hypothetical protein